MLYLKMTGACLVIVSSSLMGILLGEEHRNKIFRFQEFRNLLLYIRSGIEYQRKILPEIFTDAAAVNENAAGEFAECMGNLLMQEENIAFEDAWEHSVWKIYGKSEAKNEIALFMEPGKSIGRLDAKMRISGIDAGIQMFEQQILMEQRVVEERCRQKRMLGMLFGLFITIIFL